MALTLCAVNGMSGLSAMTQRREREPLRSEMRCLAAWLMLNEEQ